MVTIIDSENTHDFCVSGLGGLKLVAVFCHQLFLLPGEQKANDIFVFQCFFFLKSFQSRPDKKGLHRQPCSLISAQGFSLSTEIKQLHERMEMCTRDPKTVALKPPLPALRELSIETVVMGGLPGVPPLRNSAFNPQEDE